MELLDGESCEPLFAALAKYNGGPDDRVTRRVLS